VHGRSRRTYRSLASLFASTIRDTRRRLGWTQAHLADRAGLSRSAIGLLESGDGNPTIEVVGAAFEALGVDVPLVPRTPVVIGSRPRDEGHARCVAYVVRRLRRLGWKVATEVPLIDGRWRGSIDVLAWDEPTSSLAVKEVKTAVDDVGGAQRQLGWYERMASQASRPLGWHPRVVAAALILLATQTNDRVISENRDLFLDAFPVGARALDHWLRDPRLPGPRGHSIALIDPSFRGRSWLSPAAVHARRPLTRPYANLSAFLDQSRRS
jgi:transcriptional regulator with XRE-family HTH domain